MSRILPGALLAFTADILAAAGMRREEARLAADSLVQADLWGHQSHGVMRLDWYVARFAAGVCDPLAVPELITDAGALAVFDGHDGMGQVLAAHAMNDAIQRAKAHGLGAVAVRNSGHFGTAMYFTLMAARAGCIGFLTTNASPAMAPWGGREKRVGTNPWSWAAPVGDLPPMVLDIANTGVARGKIFLAQQRGEKIPQGWALTADGAPTTDPAAAIEGIILPMAEHKGYAIGVMMDMLSGVLSGGAFGAEIAGPYQAGKRSGAGHFMFVLDIARLQPIEEFAARMRKLVSDLKAVPPAQGFDEVLYPGEPEARNEARNRAEGIALPDDTISALRGLSGRYGIGFPDPASA